MNEEYTTLTDAQLQQDQPVTQPKMFALRDNFLAALRGATTAIAAGVGVDLKAFNRLLVAGNVLKYLDDQEYTANGDVWQTFFDWRFVQSGTLRMNWEQRKSSGSASSVVEIMINGVVVVTETTDNQTYISKTADLTIDQGDTVTAQHRRSINTGQAFVRNIELRTDGTASVHDSIDARLVL